MRVLHVDTGRGWRGGQQQVWWLMLGARDSGVEQLLLTPGGSPLAVRSRRAGLEVAALAAPGGSPVISPNWRVVRRYAAEVDVVHAHDAHAHTLACAASLALHNAPKVVVSRRTGFPIGWAGRLKYRCASHYIAVSEHVRWRLLQAGVPAGRISVIYDGVPPPALLPEPDRRAAFRERYHARPNSFVMGTLSTFAPEKRLGEALAVLSRLPAHIEFWIGAPAAEPDPHAEGMKLLELAREEGLEERFRVIPIGEDPGPILASLDLFLYLSRSEGLGSAILMAMAYALPVVASGAGGIPEIVRHMETGVLLEREALQDLAASILLLEHSPALRWRLGAAAREFVFAQASDIAMVQSTVDLYHQLIAKSRAPWSEAQGQA